MVRVPFISSADDRLQDEKRFMASLGLMHCTPIVVPDKCDEAIAFYRSASISFLMRSIGMPILASRNRYDFFRTLRHSGGCASGANLGSLCRPSGEL